MGHTISQYVAHYHVERNHQRLKNRLLQSTAVVDSRSGGKVQRRQRLGGMPSFYYHAVA